MTFLKNEPVMSYNRFEKRWSGSKMSVFLANSVPKLLNKINGPFFFKATLFNR